MKMCSAYKNNEQVYLINIQPFGLYKSVLFGY